MTIVKTVDAGDFGKKLIEAREQLGWKQKTLAEKLGVSSSRLSGWERGVHVPDIEMIAFMARVLEEAASEQKVKSFPQFVKEQTSVYYNKPSNDDSVLTDREQQLASSISDQRTIRAEALAVDPFSVWNAKGAPRHIVNTYAFLINGQVFVKFLNHEPDLKIKAGTIFSFQPNDYAQEDVFLLLSKRGNPEEKTVRYIDPAQGGTVLLGGKEDAPLKLNEWQVEGVCTAEIQGSNSPNAKIIMISSGIGPKNRLSPL